MIYLKKFEELNIDNDIEIILNDCKPFISDLRKCNADSLLYHSTKSPETLSIVNYTGIVKFNHRVREKPRDMPIVLHNYLSLELKEKFGWNPRSEAIFAHTSDFINSHFFGRKYIMFPIGEYKYVWNPNFSDIYLSLWSKYVIMKSGIENIYDTKEIPDKKDLQQKLDDIENSYYNINDTDSKQHFKDELIGIYDDLDKYISTCIDDNICDLLISKNEIMIKADSYYITSLDMEQELKNKIYNV